jgi:DNA polymerase-4
LDGFVAHARESARIRRVLIDLTPDVEWFDAGELVLDVTHCQHWHGAPERMARLAGARVREVSGGLPCAIGVAATGLLARYAARICRPDGILVIPPWAARERLKDVAVDEICAVDPRIRTFLASRGLRTCGEVAALPPDLLARRCGAGGRQLWLACQGRDVVPATDEAVPHDTVGQRTVLPPRTLSARVVETYLYQTCARVAARLRRLDLRAERLDVGLRYAPPAAGIATVLAPAGTIPDGRQFFERVREFFRAHWRGEAVIEIRLAATQLRNVSGQGELFTSGELRALRPLAAGDGIRHSDRRTAMVPAAHPVDLQGPDTVPPACRTAGSRHVDRE